MIALSIVNSPRKANGALVAGALASALFAGAGLGSAPAAHATCASFFGIGNSADCRSNLFSVAFAIGDGAVAHADGWFGGAFVVGTNSTASTGAGSVLNFATSLLGSNNNVSAQAGIGNFATHIGGDDNNVTTTG